MGRRYYALVKECKYGPMADKRPIIAVDFGDDASTAIKTLMEEARKHTMATTAQEHPWGSEDYTIVDAETKKLIDEFSVEWKSRTKTAEDKREEDALRDRMYSIYADVLLEGIESEDDEK